MADTSNADQDTPPEGGSETASDTAAIWAEMDQAAEAGPQGASDPDTSPGTTHRQDGSNSSDTDASSLPSGQQGDGGAAAQPSDADQAEAGKDQGEADPWADAPEHLRKLFEAEKAKTAELEKVRAGLDRKVRQLSTPSQARQQPPAARGADGGGAPKDGGGKDPFEGDEWKRIREDFPEVATPFEEMLKAQNRQIGDLTKQIDGMTAEQRAETLQANDAAVREKYPTYEGIASTKEFGEWLLSQPKALFEMAKRNGDEIVDPVETLFLLDLYHAHADKGAEAGAPPAKDGDGAGANRSGKRDRQREAAAAGPQGVQGRMTAGGEPPPNASESEIWAWLDRQEAAKKQAAG